MSSETKLTEDKHRGSKASIMTRNKNVIGQKCFL